MAFHWQADDGSLLVIFGSYLISSKNVIRIGAPLAKLFVSAQDLLSFYYLVETLCLINTCFRYSSLTRGEQAGLSFGWL